MGASLLEDGSAGGSAGECGQVEVKVEADFEPDWRAIVGKPDCGTLQANRCRHGEQELGMKRRQAFFQFAGICTLPLWVHAQTPSSLGEVVKLDKAAERITLKHNGVKNLELPAMTLVFRVRNPQWLDGLSSGDRVRFSAERIDGQITITALSKLP
jgi:Cu(I)/Ag(I) efflux system periplasmic protein CusF